MSTKEKMFETVLSGLMPSEWLGWFEVEDIENKRREWRIKLIEKVEQVPKEITMQEWSLNGYCNSIELMTFPLQGKPVYIEVIRRRWVLKGSKDSICNEYDLHYAGIKATKPFADFLKELDRDALDEFLSAWPMYRRVWEKDTSLVSILFKWISRG